MSKKRKLSYRKYQNLGLCLALFCIIALPFLQVHLYSFVEYDDPEYVSENSNVTSGVTIKNVLWAFSTGHAGNWHPVTWLSHMIDCTLFGVKPGFHHLVNMVVHCCNAILLFIFLQMTTGSRRKSFLVALLFGLHPVHVESVAWISERKDVLSAFFWFLTLISYYWYHKKRQVGRYFLVLFLFILALMAKPMAITLPMILLLLDYWPLKQLRFGSQKNAAIGSSAKIPIVAPAKSYKTLLWEKSPFLLLSLTASIITLIVQHNGKAITSLGYYSLLNRIGNAILSYGVYLWQMIVPTNLCVLYPLLTKLPWHLISASTIMLVLITSFCIKNAHRFPYLLTGWLWYGISLLPVIGLVQVGGQAHADRYTYIPLTGIFIMTVWGSYDLFKKFRMGHTALFFGYAGICAVMLVITTNQVKHWENGITLGRHTLAVTKDNYIGYENMGCALVAQSKFDEAIECFAQSLMLKPQFTSALAHMGQTYTRKREFDKAIFCFEKVIETGNVPDWVYNDLGSAFAEKGNMDTAAHYFKLALDNPSTRCLGLHNLGLVEEVKKNPVAAKEYYRQAFKMEPRNPMVAARLGFVLLNEGNKKEAKPLFELALLTYPDWPPVEEALARCLNTKEEAVRDK